MLQLPLYFWYKSGQHVLRAPVAQWIRASVFGTEGRRFESVRAYQILTNLNLVILYNYVVL